MQIRFPAGVPDGWTDRGGVFTEPQQVASAARAHEDAEKKVQKIVAERNELSNQLQPLLAKLQAGTITISERARMDDLADDVTILSRRLADAQAELTRAKDQRDTLQSAQNRARLESLLTKGAETRKEVEELIKNACLKLGEFCLLSEELVRTVTLLGRDTPFGGYPEDKNRMAEIGKPLDPLTSLFSSGYEQWKGYGYNFGLSIFPIIKRGQNGNR